VRARFFVVVKAPSTVEDIREALAQFTRVRAGGRGTQTDPDALWYEVEVPEQKAEHILKLVKKALPDGCEVIQTLRIARGEGEMMSRQMNLFGRTA
jgi:mannose/fructose/N-acetylgalactosamine-specific phosphotransferase system component IIB